MYNYVYLIECNYHASASIANKLQKRNNLYYSFSLEKARCQTICFLFLFLVRSAKPYQCAYSGVEEDQNHCQTIETIITENRVQTPKTCKTMRTNLIRLA